jgi:hypothetical protein
MQTFNYNYQSSGGQPGSGHAYQAAGSSANLLSFSNIDNDSNDNTAFLGALAVNDTIAANGTTWTIQDITIKGSNVQYTVSPAAQAPPFGVTVFAFGGASVAAGYRATIAAGQFLSNAVDIKGVGVAVIAAPLNWTSANISFRFSDDNITFFDLIDFNGNEILRTFKAGCAITIDPTITQAVNFMKIRSGSRDHQVPQETDAVIMIIPT